MEQYIYDEHNGLRYLKEHHLVVHSALILSGKLHSHLVEVGGRVGKMVDLLVKQMADRQGITEELKAQDQMAWVGAMNDIRNTAEKIILWKLTYGEGAV